MIDGIRFSVSGEAAVIRLLDSGLLKLRVIEKGEYDGLNFYIEQYKYSVCGSMHKYFRRGLHNADDFTLDDFREAILRFSYDFQVNPRVIPFTRTEFGINVVLPFDVETFLQSIVMYRGKTTKSITSDKYGGIYVNYAEYTIKIYNKSRQYPEFTLPNTVRFEVAVKKNRHINKKITGDVTKLSDNANQKVWQGFGREVLRCFDGSVINDVDVKKLKKEGNISEENADLLSDGKSYGFWKKMPPKARKKEFDKYNELLAEHSSTKKVVRQLLVDKIEFVTKSPFETFDDYVKYHQKNWMIPPIEGMNSPIGGTNSPVIGSNLSNLESIEIEACTKTNGMDSHAGKVGTYTKSHPQNKSDELTEKKGMNTSSIENENICLLAYVEMVVEKKKDKKHCSNIRALLNNLRLYGGDICIDQVNTLFIDGFVEFLRTKKGLKESYIKQQKSFLRGIMKSTIKWM